MTVGCTAKLGRLLPRIKNLHQAYGAVLAHVRQVVAGHVTSQLSEAEVRRRLDMSLDVLTEIKGVLYCKGKPGGKDVVPTLSCDQLSRVLTQLHWVEVVCLTLPSSWHKLQSDIDSYRNRTRLLIDKI